RGHLSRDAVERLVAKHTATAEANSPSIKDKNVTPHTLRHTAAMSLLQAGVHTSIIPLSPGHEDAETTHVYLHADMTIKEKALPPLQPPTPSPGRYRPPDPPLAFLATLYPPPRTPDLCRHQEPAHRSSQAQRSSLGITWPSA